MNKTTQTAEVSAEQARPFLKIVLMGNPNVGKSAVFSRLTGAHVMTSNYAGTTVEVASGILRMAGCEFEIVDVPGTYALDAASRAEEVAATLLDQADIVVNVLDATNLERNLALTLQLLRRGKPMVAALNMWDEAEDLGVTIDVALLSARLGIPVIPTCALSGEGIRELKEQAVAAGQPQAFTLPEAESWRLIGEIVAAVQRVAPRRLTFAHRVGHLTVHPLWGHFFALIVLGLSFETVRWIGEGLIRFMIEPLFDRFWLPVVARISAALGAQGFWHDLLIGHLIEGRIEFGQSMGVLTTGLFIPLGAVFPYVLAFYLVLSLLEDIGYLPRLGVLLDNLMHRVGLHGFAVVPMLLGLGCNVPGALACRVFETRKERFIAATLIGVCVPCMAQLAMVAGLLGKHGASGLAALFLSLFVFWLALGLLMKRWVAGRSPEMLFDIPPYRFPYWKTLLQKLLMRGRSFLSEAVPFVLIGVFVVNLLYTLGIIGWLSRLCGPLLTAMLGLPSEAVSALVVGVLRKDVAVGMLAPLNLSLRQLIVASVVLVAYFPCVATFTVMLRELGWTDMFKAGMIMLATAFLGGGLLNLILRAIGLT